VLTSNGAANAIAWVLDTNVQRTASLVGSGVRRPVLYAVDATTMQRLWSSTSTQLNVGGKYNHPIIAHGVVFVGTDRIQAFGLSNLTADFTITPSPASQSVIQGQSTSYTATVNPSGGFSGSVTFSVTGLPVGANGTFSPNPATGTSTISLTTNSTAAAGTYPLTITGTSGALTHTASVTLIVSPRPDFTLSASPASQSVVQGNGASYTTTVSPVGGFNGSVTLSVTGLPTGANGTFAPNPSTGASTLALTTASTTPAGSYPLAITGTSGALTHTTSAVLVVTKKPDFALSISPSSQTVLRGAGTSYTTAVVRSGGFSSSVSFTVAGLPFGATAKFSPNPSTASSTLSVSTSILTPAGTYRLTITGTQGSLTHSANTTLVVSKKRQR
jgi:hypothetical protein